MQTATTNRTSRVLLAEDNGLFRRGFSALLASDPAFQVVGEAGDPCLVLSQLRNLRPDVLVINAAFLRGGAAFSLGSAIRQAIPGLLTLVLASSNNEADLAAALAFGAKGFAGKGSSPTHLIAALRHVAFEEGGMNDSGLLPALQALSTQLPPRPASPLTTREQEIVKLLAEGKTVRAVSKDLLLSVKTVEAHKLNLMRKLDIHNRATLVAYANHSGLVPAISAA